MRSSRYVWSHGIRNCNEVTHIYGEKIIPLLLDTISVSCCILDGELLVYDTFTQRFEAFGKLKTFGISLE